MSINFPVPTQVGQLFTDPVTGYEYVCERLGPPAQWTSSGNAVSLDDSYLRLDTANDPLTGNLGIGGSQASPNISLNANGSITTNNLIGSTVADNTIGLFTNSSSSSTTNFCTFGDGTTHIGTDVSTYGGSSEIKLNPDGSATYKGPITGTFNLWSSTQNVTFTDASADASIGLKVGKTSSPTKVALYADGAIALGGVVNRGQASHAPNIELNADGSAKFGPGQSDGRVSINITSNQSALSIKNQLTGGITPEFFTAYKQDGTRLASIQGDGEIRIGTNLAVANSIQLSPNGSATFSGNITAANVSDIRFKENIADAQPQLADVVTLGSSLKNWDWKEEAPLNDELKAKRFLGLVAQEAEVVCPGITYEVNRTKNGEELTPAELDEDGNVVVEATYEQLDDGYKAINHNILVMKLLGAVAEQNALIESLTARLDAAGV